MQQLTLADLFSSTFKIDKPIRLIELFGGIGSQTKILRKHKPSILILNYTNRQVIVSV